VLFSTAIGGASASGSEKPSICEVNDRNFYRKEMKSIPNGSSSSGLATTVAMMYFGVLVIAAQSVKVEAYGGLRGLFALVE